MRLRIPAALVFTLTASCGEDRDPPPPPPDATVMLDGQVVCNNYCIDEHGGPCNGEPTCVDADGRCPAGCLPEPIS